MTHAVITFGCRANQADSLAFEEELLVSGSVAAPAESADLIVVNTCSVTASADQGARQTIRRIARVNPAARIVVTGCYATREREQIATLPNVTAVVCNDHKPQLVSVIRSTAAGDPQAEPLTSAERFGTGDGSCGAAIEPGIAGRTAFTLRVQTGCGEQCSYCIIPETRGAPRSVEQHRVLKEVQRVVAAGFREIVLTGVHLGSYGRDLPAPTTLHCLLTALRDLAAAMRETHGQEVLFRISSLEPMDCSPEIVRLVASAGCFAPHFHLPLQHASARVLRLMRRPYDVAAYADLVDRIRRDLPHASIGSDIIVGFPVESEADFGELAAYLETSPLTHLHVFPYSDRPGTAASKMGDRPSGTIVKERGAVLRRIGAQLTRRFVASQLGTQHRALTLDDGTLAVTGNYLKVRIPAGLERNQWVTLRIRETEPQMRGDVVSLPR